jgi:uncharacterized membrane protein YqjE
MSADSSEGGPQHGGLLNSIRTMLGTLIAIIHTRAELLSTELEEERIRLTSILMWGLIALFCACFGIIFVTFLFMLALWDDHRLLAVGIPAALFLSVAAVSAGVAIGKAKTKPKLFSSSLAELAKDREQLNRTNE